MLEIEHQMLRRARDEDEDLPTCREVLREYPDARAVFLWPWWLVTETGGMTGILGKGATRKRAWQDAADNL